MLYCFSNSKITYFNGTLTKLLSPFNQEGKEFSLSCLSESLPLIFLIVICLGKFLIYNIYKFESKNQLEDLYQIIGIENNSNLKPKKKPLTQIIIRLIFIPLSLLLLVGSFFFFKNGKILYGIFGVLVALSFLVSDLFLLLKKDK